MGDVPRAQGDESEGGDVRQRLDAFMALRESLPACEALAAMADAEMRGEIAGRYGCGLDAREGAAADALR